LAEFCPVFLASTICLSHWPQAWAMAKAFTIVPRLNNDASYWLQPSRVLQDCLID
jgi:hypothetical protein